MSLTSNISNIVIENKFYSFVITLNLIDFQVMFYFHQQKLKRY